VLTRLAIGATNTAQPALARRQALPVSAPEDKDVLELEAV
jgi:hypothetical protein